MIDQPRNSNKGWPSWVWNARRHATHSVAPQTKASVTALTRSTWPQRILVAFMATEDQAPSGADGKCGTVSFGVWDAVARKWDPSPQSRTTCLAPYGSASVTAEYHSHAPPGPRALFH
jgi:hypothetical protein